MKVSTKPNSLVAVLAVDQAVTFMGTDNIVSQSLLDLKLSPHADVYPYDLDAKKKIFGAVNAFKISPTTEKKQPCTVGENALFVRHVGVHEGAAESWSGQPKLTKSAENAITRNEFPEVWFQEALESPTGTFNLRNILPDSITSWVISGFSINPQFGFAVAEQKKVKVFQDFFIRIEKPYIVKLGEIVNIKVIIHNYMSFPASTSVTLNNKRSQFEFVESGRNSLALYKSFNTQVKPEDTAQVTFKIRPKDAGKIVFNINAKSSNAVDEIEESFLVEVPGITKHETRSVVVNLKNDTLFEDELTFEVDSPVTDSVEFEAVTSSDLLGPALDNLETLM
jgi:CD109 antigen